MGLFGTAKMRQDIDELFIRVNSIAGAGDAGAQPNITPLSPPSTNFTPVPPVVHPSAVNQLRNGDYSHSVMTWNETSPVAGDENYECVWWYSNDAPVNGQLLSADNSFTDPGNPNETLKSEDHSAYDPDYSDWNRSTGVARFQGITTIDAPLPSNVAKPGITEFVGAIVARRDIGYPEARIVIPEDCLMFAGVWDDTAGQLDWLHGTAFSLSASVRGTPATTTERRYKIYAKTDKGYSFLSVEATVANAPSDAAFLTGGSDVLLSWESIPGILEYDVYRHDITAAKYRILESIGNGATTYADNGSINIDDDAGGYPTATNASAIAYASTFPGDLRRNVTIDGVAPFWPPLFLNIGIPSTYDQSVTTDAQWVRLGLTMPLDRQMSDGAALNGDNTLTTTTSTTFSSADVSRAIVVTDADLNELSTTISSINSSGSIEMADPWPYADADPVTISVTEGGDHGLEIDLTHTSFVARAAYAPNPEDLNRALQPAATPNGSSQGGPGGGGGPTPGGGGVGCIDLTMPVITMIGERYRGVEAKDVIVGDALFSGDMACNQMYEFSLSDTNDLQLVRTENGVELLCSPRQPIMRSRIDVEGLAVNKLRIGENVLTAINGRVERSAILEIISTGKQARVWCPSLHPGHKYFAGRRYHRFWWQRVYRAIRKRITGKADIVGLSLHNIKPSQDPGDIT